MGRLVNAVGSNSLETTYILFKLPYYSTPVHKFLNALPNTLERPMCNLWYIKTITYWPNFHDFLLSDFLSFYNQGCNVVNKVNTTNIMGKK